MSTPKGGQLQRGLKNRHIQMIALGGAIGTGLFYGSAESIRLVGPGIILSYLIGGAVMYLIMRMLGEMSAEEPVAGAFSHFAYKYWGEFPGFLAGWNYWFLYILVSMAELTVVGIYVAYWLPEFPHWATSLIVLTSITLINLVNVRFYGELEFWFALVKVLAVIGMIVLGLALIFLGLGGPATGFDNLWTHDGFLPNGVWGLLLSLVVVMFSFGGTELIGIAAGEADDPRRSIPRAVKQVMWRILLFYIGSLTVMMIIFPWNEVGTEGSPFVTIFSRLGIGSAANILNFVVLTAAISVYNSGIYSNGRMLYSLAAQGNAPKIFMTLGGNKVPYVAILFSSACTLAAVVINYVIPEGAFMQVMALATTAATITWGMIMLVHLRFRRAHAGKVSQLAFPAPFFPYANYACVAFMVLIVVMMTQLDSMRNAVYVLPVWLAVLYVGFRVKLRAGGSAESSTLQQERAH
ncbi:amino acid permease [Consotaella salsifontis]|uniref:Amino acid/polyamine/organocation transporter, APC superfamily n=1 Tax=Consotaella salsifontis TaxID=1365950 RepID=A0A1T4TE63_9HYPH|nr:amino acid permease [Consotaella salsifontis]SKA38752.1 amino acid/polyamine/organocation transporter, APC superfamily [Consotaella salsifontis]